MTDKQIKGATVPPPEIFLQVYGGDAAEVDMDYEVDFGNGDVTWSRDRVFDTDAKYTLVAARVSGVDLRPRSDIAHEEATANPIFLYQVKFDRRRAWETRSVWYTRDEAEQFAASNEHNFKYWRVFCVPACGDLAKVLKCNESD